MIFQVKWELPSIRLFFILARLNSRYSLLRAFQYKHLDGYKFDGNVIDFGGGDYSDYRLRITSKSYRSINIDESIEPTWLISPGDSFYKRIGKYKYALSLNTLEHIYDPKKSLVELSSTLEDGGQMVLSTPFIFKIHGHPNDFCRLTPDWYRVTLKELGFKNCIVTLLYWGYLSTAATVAFKYGPNKFVRIICLAIDLIYFKIKILLRPSDSMPDCPLGLWVVASK